MNENLRKVDIYVLSHLRPYGKLGYSDTYTAYISKHLTINAYTNMCEKIETWVYRNGGRIKWLGDTFISGYDRCREVKIIFPTFGKRDMKNIMATLFYDSKINA